MKKRERNWDSIRIFALRMLFKTLQFLGHSEKAETGKSMMKHHGFSDGKR